MTARLSYDKKYIIIENTSFLERKKLESEFTKKVPNWFIIKNKNPNAKIEESFINDYYMIPTGLYMELIKICKDYDYKLDFIDNFDSKIKNYDVKYDNFIEYIDKLFSKSKLKPMQYQLQGAYNILLYQNSGGTIALSGSGEENHICFVIE